MTRLANPSADAVYVDDVVCMRETAKAVLVDLAGDEVWIPKSVLHDDSEVTGEGDSGRLAVRRWWGEKEGLE